MLKTNKLALLLLTFLFSYPINYLSAQQRACSAFTPLGSLELKTVADSLAFCTEIKPEKKQIIDRNTSTHLAKFPNHKLTKAYSDGLHHKTLHFIINEQINTNTSITINTNKNNFKNYGITFGLQLTLNRYHTPIQAQGVRDKNEYQYLQTITRNEAIKISSHTRV